MNDFRGPLAKSYPGAVALVVCALVPFLMLTAAVFPLLPAISRSLHLSMTALDVTIGMSDAGYAFGTVMAVQFAVHLPARRMLLVYVSVFVIAAVLAASARSGGVFIGAFVVEGLCTSLMLIAAVPPLVIGWPPAKMPITGGIMNLCIFGAVAIGPTVGGFQATAHGWRPLFWGVAGVACLALVFSLLTYEDAPPQDRSAPWDFVAIALAGLGCAAAFFGASWLEATGAVDAASLAPLLAGAVAVTALVVYEYRAGHPLMPVKGLATVFPTTGVAIAIFASCAAFGLMELVMSALEHRFPPAHTALLFLPEFAAAVATAGLFGALFKTRYTPVLAFSGLGMLVGAAAVLSGVAGGGNAVVAAGAGLIGLGVGASVSPALFLAGFSLRSEQIQRVFALVELLRGVSAFLVAPILLFLSTVIAAPADPRGGSGVASPAGVEAAIWICLGIAACGLVLTLAIFKLGRGRLQTPDLERWEHGEPAWESPSLVEGVAAGR